MGRFLFSGARHFSTAFSFPPQSCISPCNPLLYSRSAPSSLLRSRAFGPKFSLRASSTAPNFSAAMASAAALPTAVEGLSLQSTAETSKFPNSFPSLNPVDIYREHIAEKLALVSGIEAEKIYPKLSWTSTLDKGDLTLPVCD